MTEKREAATDSHNSDDVMEIARWWAAQPYGARKTIRYDAYMMARELVSLASLRSETEPKFEAMLNWLGNRVLACDYGDPGPGIGWRIRHNLLARNSERQPAFMWGSSFGEAIRAQMEKSDGKKSSLGSHAQEGSDSRIPGTGGMGNVSLASGMGAPPIGSANGTLGREAATAQGVDASRCVVGDKGKL